MIFLPIVERELRVAARKRGTYWMRIGAAVAALLIGGWIMLMMHRLPPQHMGKAIFYSLSSVMFIFASVTGLRLTSDCLSEEKRDGTLGLLFLTDLKGYDVVFGKLAASSIGSLYAMLASFPVLAVSLLLGGVTYGEFWRVAFVAVNILFLSLSAGIFASSISRDERKAVGLAFVLVVLLALGPPVGGWIYYSDRSSQYDPSHLLFTPAYASFLAFDFAFKTKETLFWTTSAITQVYAWLFLLLACRIVPRSWQDKANSKRKQKAQETISDITLGSSAERKSFRGRMLDVNPFYWLASRERMKPRLVWGFLVICGLGWIWGWAKVEKDWLNPATYILTAIVLHTVLKYWLAGEACRRLLDDRRSGALELMLSTPITVKEVLRGQQLALMRQFLTPALFICAVDLLMMVGGLAEMRSDESEWITVWFAGTVIFLFDLYTLAWLGMWQAMTNQKVNRAAGGALARVLFLPWLAFGVTFAVVAVLALSPLFRNTFNFDVPGELIALYWMALSAANNVIWLTISKGRLNTRFREIATERFEAPRPFWRFAKLDKPPVVAGR